MKKQCQECKRVLDASSFNGSSKEPDGLAKKCRACVNRRRRELHASKTGDRKPAHLGTLVKKGDYAAIKSNRRMITAEQPGPTARSGCHRTSSQRPRNPATWNWSGF